MYFRTWQTIQTRRLMAPVLKLAVLVVSVTAVLVRHSPLRVCPRRTQQKPRGRRESYRDGWTEKPSLSCPRKWGPTACFVRTEHCGPVYIRFQPLHALVLYKIKLWFTDRLVSLFLSEILVIMPSNHAFLFRHTKEKLILQIYSIVDKQCLIHINFFPMGKNRGLRHGLYSRIHKQFCLCASFYLAQ